MDTSAYSIENRSRRQLFADKFAFNKDSIIPVNALSLIDELVEQERLTAENAKLRERISLLESLLASARSNQSEPQQLVVYNNLGRISL